ncbi:hypothetical protein [Streptomyces sp. 5-10]|uniref:hypothetical protein n=1 Tax=Streptomyces sp. 5-10 TaxID=878925 RepID=UPI00168ACA95|nr:hypothetical protein [Streptomyces sp. 5-10]MBD3004592.1 hypothetical protein [Streptomyces sp. 5-10]
MKKTIKLMFAGVLAGLAALFAPNSAGAAEKDVCLTAEGPNTYRLCVALKAQPAYEWTNPSGSKTGVPNGVTLIKELRREGQTPNRNAAGFRGSAQVLTEEYFDHKGGDRPQDDGGCLKAVNSETYVLCRALWEQPSYDREDGLSNPEGSEIVAELAEEGVTPSRNAGEFRRESRTETGEFFVRFRR